MEKPSKHIPVEPLISITRQPESIDIECSDGIETIRYSHSFSDQKLFYQRITASNQAILKACSNKQRSIQTVLDLTGGWGIDSFILAQHGKRVTMLEQNTFIHSVVAQSLLNAASISHTRLAAQRIDLVHGNSIDYLQALDKNYIFDCIYLDPMFPEHRSNAKPGKEMQLLQRLTDNIDIEDCFNLALQKAAKRVVVKRPAKASPITALKPDLNYREKTIRFDIYLTQAQVY